MYYARKAQPVANKKLHQAEVKRRQDLHRARLASMKPSVDTKPPATISHAGRNAKREALMEERYAKIEHDNRILLTKMSAIMSRPHSMDTVNLSWQYGHSLNRTKREKEIMRISQENAKILERIQRVQPLYSHVKWEEDRIKQEKLLESIAEYKPSIYGGLRSPRGGSVHRETDDFDESDPVHLSYGGGLHDAAGGHAMPAAGYADHHYGWSAAHSAGAVPTYKSHAAPAADASGDGVPLRRSVLAASGSASLGPSHHI